MILLKSDEEAYNRNNVHIGLLYAQDKGYYTPSPWWYRASFKIKDGQTFDDAWNEHEWLPSKNQNASRHDPNPTPPDLTGVSSKPTSDDVKGWVRELEINELFTDRIYDKNRQIVNKKMSESEILSNVSEAANKLATAPVAHSATPEGDAIHIGGGIDRFSAISHILEDTTTAGKAFPRSVFRTLNRDTVTIWHEEAGRELVGKVARTANDIESAKNIVYNKHRMQLEIIREDALSIGIRIKAVNEFEALREPERLRADLIDALMIVEDRDLLPRDLDTAQITLIGRLEAHAVGTIKRLVDAVTQQGVDLPPSCSDQQTAMTSISNIKQSAQIEINRQETVISANEAYKLGIARIDAVRIIRLPSWVMDGKVIEDSAITIDYTGPINLVASHPDIPFPSTNDSAIEGNVAITVKNPNKRDMSFIRSVPVTSKTSHSVNITARESGKIRLIAKNICGARILNITLKASTE